MIATLHAHPSQSNHDPKQLRQSGSGHLPHCFPSGVPPPQEAPGAPQSVQRLKRQPSEFQRQMKWQQATYQTLPNTVHRVATGVMKAASAGQPDSTATGGADQAGRGLADVSLTGMKAVAREWNLKKDKGQRGHILGIGLRTVLLATTSSKRCSKGRKPSRPRRKAEKP